MEDGYHMGSEGWRMAITWGVRGDGYHMGSEGGWLSHGE